jgi:hypothetical protein
MEGEHDVYLLPLHPYLSLPHVTVSLSLSLSFLSGALLVHKCVHAHALALMTFASLYDVDGDTTTVGICSFFFKSATLCAFESMTSFAS